MKKQFSKLIAAIAITFGISSMAMAQQPEIEAKYAPTAAAFEKAFNAKPAAIHATKVPGLLEVFANGQIVYVDKDVTFLIDGQWIEAANKTNVTQDRLSKLNKIDFNTLPFDQAIKTVKGNGSKKIVAFEDPRCTYCKKLHTESFAGMTDYTLYTFLVGILGPESEAQNKRIWCAQDRSAALQQNWAGSALQEASPVCDTTGLARNMDLARKVNLRGTPLLVFKDGSTAPGALPTADIEARIKAAAEKAPKGN